MTVEQLPGLPPQVGPPDIEASAAPWAELVRVPDGPDAPEAVVALMRGVPGWVGFGDEEPVRLLGLDPASLLRHHLPLIGEPGQVAVQPVLSPVPRTLLLVNVGDGSPTGFRRAGAAVARAARDRSSVAVAAPAEDDALTALVVGLVLGSYCFSWRSKRPSWVPVSRVVLVGAADRDAVVRRGETLARAAWRARLLASVPSNLKSPEWLAGVATGYAAESGLAAEVLDETALHDGGFGGLLAVGGGSATPPRLVRLAYRPARPRRRTPHVVLVGKGITFDSGGLSIKTVEGMRTMKRDMTGGAVVMATLAALGSLGCRVRVTGLVAAAENAVGAASYRPGDVVRHYGGRTSEVSNTDAEGRLVLADAMAYAVAELEPDVLVDVATLTGAMKVALGQRTAGLFATDDALAGALRVAGAAAGEPWWRMPLDRRYDERIASRIADADNSASPGAIAAALFLRPFAGDVPWAHLDVASVGDSPTDTFEWSEGPTGFGVRTLLTWLSGPAPLEGVGG